MIEKCIFYVVLGGICIEVLDSVLNVTLMKSSRWFSTTFLTMIMTTHHPSHYHRLVLLVSCYFPVQLHCIPLTIYSILNFPMSIPPPTPPTLSLCSKGKHCAWEKDMIIAASNLCASSRNSIFLVAITSTFESFHPSPNQTQNSHQRFRGKSIYVCLLLG